VGLVGLVGLAGLAGFSRVSRVSRVLYLFARVVGGPWTTASMRGHSNTGLKQGEKRAKKGQNTGESRLKRG
jgi:hypothetical protein